ncbi:MAG: hypothetical protein P8Y45_20680 [Exilibacterium sp.]
MSAIVSLSCIGKGIRAYFKMKYFPRVSLLHQTILLINPLLERKMATILFNSWPLYGPVSCLLDIADRLKNNGHRVCFVGIADGEAMIRAQGFEFFPIFEQIFPKGIMRQADKVRDNCNSLGDIYRAIMQQKQNISHYFSFLVNDGNFEFQSVVKPATFAQ